MYSVPNLPPLLEYLLNDPTNSPVDLAISRYRNTFGPPGFLLQPNIVSHIGRISSTGPPKPALEYLYNMGLWKFSTGDFCEILVYVQATILVVERQPYQGVDSRNLQSPILSKGSCCPRVSSWNNIFHVLFQLQMLQKTSCLKMKNVSLWKSAPLRAALKTHGFN